ncbi:hypothetical protein [Klebsiella sp. BIGb0407]|uniref:hypothetical protein n=1 Tax=Klebsiella sp. BIGb0407 TaxID=2940603 RepID=UPI002169A332|nr:hypothetical protein [Klebsiella sp. BIGb0407]MCS3430912.1 hypothetical protein [Klebsiella sp. BIGb0407]
MIGSLSGSSNNVSIGSGSYSERAPLNNHPATAISSIENTSVELHIINKESSLFNSAMAIENLQSSINSSLRDNQNARLFALGVAVTAVTNMFEQGKAKEISESICDKYPRDTNIELKNDISINKRGEEYIRHIPDTVEPLDVTVYAMGLNVGYGISINEPDPVLINSLNAVWNMRLNRPS